MKTSNPTIILICSFILLASLTGCKSYFHIRYGVKKPGEESPEKLIAFLQKHHFPADNQYRVADATCYSQLMSEPAFRKNLLSHLLFDHNGRLLFRDTTKCQWAGSDQISQLPAGALAGGPATLQLSWLLERIRPLDAREINRQPKDNQDYTLIVVWAKFLGKYNYRLFDLAKAVEQNQTASIRLIWLNVDMMKEWHLTRDQRMTFR